MKYRSRSIKSWEKYFRFDAYLLTEGKEVPFALAFITINAKKLIQNYENKKIREVFNIIKLK